jgi:hypothetical protein
VILRAVVPLIWFAVPAAAQSSVALGKPDAEFPEPFTRLRAVAELADRRVLTTELQDKVVQLVDFAKGTAVKVGREGQGPGEWALPGALFKLPDGSVWLHDLLNRRFLPIGPDGKPGEAVPMPTLGTGGGPLGGIMIGPGASGTDGRGRIYFQGQPFSIAAGKIQPVDSMPILRWDRVHPTLDTVAWIRGPKNSATASGGGGQLMVRIGGGKVFTPEEGWGVASDGSVARVLPAPFQVVWYPPNGRPQAGPVVPYTPIRVTEADRREFVEQQKRNKPQMIAIGPGGRSAAPPPGSIQQPTPEFEETKPPFSGNQSVLVAPEGEVWVLRSRPASDRTPAYDVFDRSGRPARRVTLEPGSRVVGFGSGTVYTVKLDDEDLEHLQRFRR